MYMKKEKIIDPVPFHTYHAQWPDGSKEYENFISWRKETGLSGIKAINEAIRIARERK